MRGDRILAKVRSPGPLPFVVASIILLVLYSSWNRPLWYDEMVYFVLGGFDSTTEVLRVIDQTTTNVNQGVTGAYMLLSYWSLELFGAHAWALRLPSLLFATYLLFVSAIFLRGRRVGWWGLAALPVLLMGQETLMYYAGEARTYMPLAAATVGVLAYYFIPLSERRRWGPRLLGWSAVIIGVLFHPYFALYWPLILVFAITVKGKWSMAIRFANPALVAVGTIVYFTVAAFTWLRGTARTEALDPYIWLGDSLAWAIPSKLVQFVYVQRPLIALTVLTVLLTLILVARGKGIRWMATRWWPPLLLITLAFLASWILAAISIVQGFWIIQRQWIASIALVSVGIIWFWSRALASVRVSSGKTPAVVVRFLVGTTITLSAISPAVDQLSSLLEWQDNPLIGDEAQQLSEADLNREIQRTHGSKRPPLEEFEWISYSNANIGEGGDVWRAFRHYYLDRDWTSFVIRDQPVQGTS